MSPLVPPRILTADDYAMTAGVSRAIEALAQARKISATSAMTTCPSWLSDAPRVRELRGHIAVGLHLNLTLGTPAAPARSLAPSGSFQDLQPLLKRSLSRQLDPTEVRDEICRQLDLFERALGFAPDHIDGHQHVHVLPGIRGPLLAELAARYRSAPPLLRDPSEQLGQIARHSPARAKAMIVRGLAFGFRRAAVASGMIVNTSFSGFSAFDTARPFKAEMIAALDRRHDTARLKIVMCHPGFPDAELARLDPVVARRQQEHDALLELAPPEAAIWHPLDPTPTRGVPDWAAMAGHGTGTVTRGHSTS
jgi:chitin disaccharide deacetylase